MSVIRATETERFLLPPPSLVGGEVVIKCDGSSVPNPGHGSAAVTLHRGQETELQGFRGVYLGNRVANNEAEHYALLMALETVRDCGMRGPVTIESDSKCAVAHYNRVAYPQKRTEGELVDIMHRISLSNVQVIWVNRDEVGPAHNLCKEILQGREPVAPIVSQNELVAIELFNILRKYKLDATIVGRVVSTSMGEFTCIRDSSHSGAYLLPSMGRDRFRALKTKWVAWMAETGRMWIAPRLTLRLGEPVRNYVAGRAFYVEGDWVGVEEWINKWVKHTVNP